MSPTPTGLMPFVFEESLVRIRQDEQGSPWFVPKDVCTVLGIEMYRDALTTLDDDEKGCPVVVDTLGGPQEMSVISESGLYALAFLTLRFSLLTEQIHELGSLAGQPLSPLGRQSLAFRHATLAEELVLLSALAAQEECPATAQTGREAAA